MDLHEAISTAIEHEHRIRDHYARGAEAILDPQGKRVFATLAKEEQGHVAYLENRLNEWRANGKVTSPELTTLLPPLDWVEAAKARVKQAPPGTIAVKGEMELLKVALDLERQTSAFYGRLVDTLRPADRGLFARFLEIEQAHLAIVQAEIDAIAGHGTWFDVMEFRLEAG